MTSKAAIYARYSSEIQNERSIADQLALCRNYAEREGFQVVLEFADKARSGSSLFDRDGLIDLMQAAKRREFSCMVPECGVTG